MYIFARFLGFSSVPFFVSIFFLSGFLLRPRFSIHILRLDVDVRLA